MFAQILLITINCATPASQNSKSEKHGYNILAFFHMPCRSHHILGSTLLKELARRGHNVTMVSSFPFEEKIPNYTDIELKDMMGFKKGNQDTLIISSSLQYSARCSIRVHGTLHDKSGLHLLEYLQQSFPYDTETGRCNLQSSFCAEFNKLRLTI